MKKMNFIKPLSLCLLGLGVVFVSCKREGCTDPVATNYEKKANQDDGTCIYGPIVDTTVTSFVLDYNIDVATVLPKGIYSVPQTIDVNAALTLTAGSVFIFEATHGLHVRSGGSVSAIGTAAEPIVFRGEAENSHGYWAGINIASNNPNNYLEYVTIQDGGSYWAWEYAGLYVADGARLTLKNSTVSRSKENGLFAEDNSTLSNFSNNSFSNNLRAGVSVGTVQVGSLDIASSYNLSNGEAYIEAREGTINSPQTWLALGSPILLLNTMDVNAALTINPGVKIMQAAGEGINVRESGSLTAIGTASQPIVIEGQFASPGYAAGIQINSNNPANKFAYVNMSHLGSYWAWEYSAINVHGRLEIDNCSITNSNSWAIYAEGSSTIVTNGTTQTTAAGVTSNNTLAGNGAGADADCVGGGCTIYFE